MSLIEPAVILLLVLASVYGGLAHLIWGKRWRQLAIYWAIAFIGCLAPYIFKLRLNSAWPNPGGIPIIEATATAWLLLLIASQGRV